MDWFSLRFTRSHVECSTHLHCIIQAVFLAYMVVLKKSANVGLSAFLIVFTVIVKLM